MKHTFTRRHYHGKSLPPLRTIQELAEEFNLTMPQLRAFLAHSEDAPKPARKFISGDARNTWYDPAAVRAWWKRKNKETSNATPKE